LHPRAEEFRRGAQETFCFDPDIREFAEGTKTAAAAADAVGCDVEQIVKSIVMRVGGETVLVLTSGGARVDESKLAAEFDVDADQVRTANADEVKAATGWSIGGVPPFCHSTELPVLGDPAFESYEELWGAAGTPETMFPLSPDQLVEFVDPSFVDVYER
jgi:prolyl-tRNA editing enzyme YbaK/EbsC (Cys-tRNA(Pro) deacylase)